MGILYWGKGKPSSPPSKHERAHELAGKGERLPNPHWWTDRHGNARIAHDVPHGRDGARRAAVVQAAGYLSSGDGFRDDDNDRAYAEQLAKEAGVRLSEIEAEARRKGYVL
jgi:hypothetical protein